MTIYKNKAIYKDREIFGSYLAGLWEGDGHILIPKRGNPSAHITFSIKNVVLAQKLLNVITHLSIVRHKSLKLLRKIGSIRYKTENNACVLNITTIQGLQTIVDLINGKLKTPKKHKVGLVIDFLNKHLNNSIEKLPLCTQDMQQNAWLSGFIDADGSFGIRNTKKINTVKKAQVKCRFRLEQRMIAHTLMSVMNHVLAP